MWKNSSANSTSLCWTEPYVFAMLCHTCASHSSPSLQVVFALPGTRRCYWERELSVSPTLWRQFFFLYPVEQSSWTGWSQHHAQMFVKAAPFPQGFFILLAPGCLYSQGLRCSRQSEKQSMYMARTFTSTFRTAVTHGTGTHCIQAITNYRSTPPICDSDASFLVALKDTVAGKTIPLHWMATSSKHSGHDEKSTHRKLLD